MPEDQVAYLVVKDGNSWRDVFRLNPDQVTTVGRAPTNRIVIHDELCSRNHCEVFHDDEKWMLKDLGSRNGTLINGMRVDGEWELQEAERIQIGSCELGFTFDISQPFPEDKNSSEIESDSETALDYVLDQPGEESEPAIIHRTRSSRYQANGEPESVGRDRVHRELAKLYRLALEMGSTPNARALSKVVLEGIFS